MNTISPTRGDNTTPNRLLGLQSRLVIATLLLCLGLVAGTFWCAQHAAKNAARVQFGVLSETTLQLMHEATQSRVLSLDEGIASAVLDPIFRAQLSRLRQSDASFGLDESGTDSPLPIAEVHDVLSSAELPYFRRYDFFLIATNEKILILNRAQTTAQGVPLTFSLLEQADKQATVAEFVAGSSEGLHKLGADPTQLYLIIAKKIVVSGQSLGYIVVGEAVNHGLLKELDRVSQAQSGIALDNKLWFRDASAQAVAANFLQQSGHAQTDTSLQPLLGAARTDFNWQGQEYFVKTAENGLILVKPISKDLALLTNELTLQFVFFIVPLSLLALFAAFAYAQFFAKPIVDLTEEVKKVKAGNYAAKMPVFRRDEVGELARAFNDMTESLSALRIDPLTGLYSEQYLKDTLAFELTYAVTHNKHLALVNLNIADFENTIITVGEDEARNILQRFADHLTSQHKRTKDVAARGDEDEFWLLMIDTDLPHARENCQHLLADTHSHMQPLHLGLAVFNAHISDVDGFMQAARCARIDAEKLGINHMALARGIVL